jgi:hypothetical protein
MSSEGTDIVKESPIGPPRLKNDRSLADREDSTRPRLETADVG